MRLRIFLPLAAVSAASVVLPSSASASFAHTILPGESLSSVAAADGLSVAQLAAANGIAPGSQLISGAILMIPPQGGGGVPATSTSGASGATSKPAGDDGQPGAGRAPSGAYIVQPGDTLSAIATRAGTTVSQLAAANGLDPSGLLLSGTALRVTGLGTVPVSTSAASSQPVGAAAQGSAGAPPYPTPETVSASEVGRIAASNGVSPSLAQAIGWQESGFNNDLVSSAGARGVMQILPGTWDWVQRTLTAGSPLAPASATDNVRGGVLLLRSLLNATGGDPALAAAGYYQGLPSVRRNGLYTDTQQYINNVMALRQRFGGP